MNKCDFTEKKPPLFDREHVFESGLKKEFIVVVVVVISLLSNLSVFYSFVYIYLNDGKIFLHLYESELE